MNRAFDGRDVKPGRAEEGQHLGPGHGDHHPRGGDAPRHLTRHVREANPVHHTEVAISEPFRVQRRQRAQLGAARGVGADYLAPQRKAARAAIGRAHDAHRLAHLLQAKGDLIGLGRSVRRGSALQQVYR